MNAIERRSVQQKGWLGLTVLAALPVMGVLMLSTSLSLFLVVLLVVLLCSAFAVGFALLSAKLRVRQQNPLS